MNSARNSLLPMLVFTVISGPDEGKTERFALRSVVIGRGSAVDFAINDRLAALQHGRLYHDGDTLWYEDLSTRHGTVLEDAVGTATLHSSSQILRRSIRGDLRLVIGETILFIQHFNVSPNDPTRGSNAGSHVPKMSATIESPLRLSEADLRLVALFQMAGELWRATDAEAALGLGCAAILRAFPSLRGVEIATIEQSRWPGLRSDRWRTPQLPGVDALGAETAERCIATALPAHSARSPDDSRTRIAIPMQTKSGAVGSILLTASASSPLLRTDIDVAEAMASLITAALERIRLELDVLAMFDGIVSMCVAAVDARDPATAGHSARVAELALQLFDAHVAEASIDADPSRRETLRYAALLHDIGKIAVREDVLMKSARLNPAQQEIVQLRAESARCAVLAGRPLQGALAGGHRQEELAAIDALLVAVDSNLGGRTLQPGATEVFAAACRTQFVDSRGRLVRLLMPSECESLQVERGTLTEGERGEMQAHVEYTRQLLERIPWPAAYADVPAIAALHHEKLDGSGYPLGLDARALPMEARMLTIADIFDAMAGADRIYRPAATKEIATDALRGEAAAGALDPALVERFVRDVVLREPDRAVRKTG